MRNGFSVSGHFLLTFGVEFRLYVASYRGMSCVQPSHKRASRRRTYGCAGIMAVEFKPLFGERIYVGSRKFFLPIAAEIPYPHIVRKNKNYVGFVGLCIGANPA